MDYLTRWRLGPKQSLTKEGWLLCEEVPIARTGQMEYREGEVPLPPDANGRILIDRFPEDVFRPETLSSFNGKDVVNEHPDEDVKPENWRWLTCGVVMNARRGAGAQEDLMLADLLVKDPAIITQVREGKREVSCGYDADYVQAMNPDGSPMLGRGKQINIIGNHVALVAAGRCGPRCAIGDSKPEKENRTMSWIDKVKAAFAGKDEAALNAALAEAPKGETISLTTEQVKALNRLTTDSSSATVDAIAADVRRIGDSVSAIDARVKRMEDAEEERKKKDDEDEDEDRTEDEGNRAIEGDLEMEAPPGTSDGIAGKARDSAYLVDSFQEAVSLAEIIAPGIAVPTVDAKAEPKRTLDALCRFRRTVLDAAVLTPELFTFITNTTGGRDYKTMDCNATRTLFRAVGQHKRALNNAASARDAFRAPTESGNGSGAVGTVKTPAELNRKMAEFYKH